MSAVRDTLVHLDVLPPWAIVLIVVAFNAARLAVLVDALSRAVVRIAVARRLVPPNEPTAAPDLPDRRAAELSSTDLAQMVHDALAAGSAAPDQPEPGRTETGSLPPPVPPPAPPDREKAS